MFDFQQKKPSYKKFIHSPGALFVLFILTLIVLKALWGVYKKERLSAEYLAREQGEYNKMIARKNELTQSVEYLKTDRGVEAEIRSKFRVVKEGESVAVIVDNDASTSAPEVSTTTNKSGWQKFTELFGF